MNIDEVFVTVADARRELALYRRDCDCERHSRRSASSAFRSESPAATGFCPPKL